MTEWLRHNTTPSSQVHIFMEKTAVKRAEWIRGNTGQDLQKVVQEFPRLFHTPGMVELDFRALFPDVSDKLCMVWTASYADEVLKYASLQSKWQSYLPIHTAKMDSDEKKTNVSLSLLPCILPPGRKGKKRASIDESVASYIDVKPIGTNIPKYLEEVTNHQPYILLLGSLLEPLQMFVIVERKALEQPSLLKAVDVCFKLFYVLDLKYPWQCATSWEFFQKVIFGLEDDKGDKTSPAVIAMRTALKHLAK